MKKACSMALKHELLDTVFGAENWRGKGFGDTVIYIPVSGPVRAQVEFKRLINGDGAPTVRKYTIRAEEDAP